MKPLDSFPEHKKIAEEISQKSNVPLPTIQILGSEKNKDAWWNSHSLKMGIGEGLIENKKGFTFTTAHELGHVKYDKLHKHLNFGRLNNIYTKFYYATTNLYKAGGIAYLAMGENYTSDIASFVADKTAPYLIGAVLLKGAIIRTREYMADIFAYEQTGILPSEAHKDLDSKNKRVGLLGNISKAVQDVNLYLTQGYPLDIERDIAVKIFAKKKGEVSFVEKVEAERAPKENQRELVRERG